MAAIEDKQQALSGHPGLQLAGRGDRQVASSSARNMRHGRTLSRPRKCRGNARPMA